MSYEEKNYASYRVDDKYGMEPMANFVAEITKEVRYVDGMNTQTTFTITGLMAPLEGEEEPVELPPVEVSAEAFPSMKWVVPCWGIRCIIMPGGVTDDLRTMIQQRSKPVIQVVYKQTGWVTADNKRTYLHAGGGITAKGNDPSITVSLPPELMRYNLVCDYEPEDCVAASLKLLDLADKELMWPILAATLAPVFGAVDFAIHTTGRTGSFKSELAALAQAHYGGTFDARTLPGSWSSTPNAIEALAYYAANAVFVLDDFVPSGTSWQQRNIQANADKIIRAQGNQSGRARLTDTASLQQTMYPRGLIYSTGEDTPEGHSVRARMLILELKPGDIDPDDLTAAQANRPFYCGTIAWLVQLQAKAPSNIKPRVEALRSQFRNIGHSRTPGMLGRLIAGAEEFLALAAAAGFITDAERQKHAADAFKAITTVGMKQQSYLEDADPVDVFQAAIRQVLATNGHVRTQNGGVPRKADVLGWTSERAIGEMSTYKARGACIGWVNWPKNELYLDMVAGYKTVAKAAGADLSLSKQTLGKRLKDAGLLKRIDAARGRNTCRVVCENHPRDVLVLSLSTVLQLQDLTDVEEETDGGSDDNDGLDAAGNDESAIPDSIGEED